MPQLSETRNLRFGCQLNHKGDLSGADQINPIASAKQPASAGAAYFIETQSAGAQKPSFLARLAAEGALSLRGEQ